MPPSQKNNNNHSHSPLDEASSSLKYDGNQRRMPGKVVASKARTLALRTNRAQGKAGLWLEAGGEGICLHDAQLV